MKISWTLGRYMSRTYLANLALMLFVLLGVIYLFDMVELLRRASKGHDVALGTLMQMGLLKLPDVGQMILPFAVLFSAMFTFWKLTRRYELIVMRSAGLSVWQFLAPILAVGLLLGVFQMAMMNPLGAALVNQYKRMETEYLNKEQGTIAAFSGGFWLRQPENDGGYAILRARKIQLPEWKMSNVMALFYGKDDSYERRLDAESAQLADGKWLFRNAQIYQGKDQSGQIPLIALPTSLTANDIEESFASPDTMSFWSLPGYIKNMEETGFDPIRLRIHFQTLLAQPLMFVAMIFLAACVSLRPPRNRGVLVMVMAGIFIGFLVFFLSSFLQALGASKQIPVPLAAWAPAVVASLFGASVLFTLEDG